jgi:branched-chain amino acid transport system substrate-binding protein
MAGAYSSDNAITVGPLANELEVPLISWAGTERLRGEYCVRLGNGDVGGDATLVVAWLKKHGYERVAVLSELSPNGEEYFRFFRQEARRRNLRIAAVETVNQSPADLAANLAGLRAAEPDALVYMGYGMLAAKGLLRDALDQIGWDPPRIMGTAFMFYLMGFDKFEGWVGIDQLDPTNPLVPRFLDRYVARYGANPRCGPMPSRCSRTTLPACSSKPSSAPRSCPALASRPAWRRSGSCPAPPAGSTPTSPPRLTNTACSAATGSSMAASTTARSSSKDSSNHE